MQITDYLKPAAIQSLFEEINDNLNEQTDNEQELDQQKSGLEKLKAQHFASSEFVPEKNLTIQEGKFRAMWPSFYDRLETLEAKKKSLKEDAERMRQTRDRYRMIIDYFGVIQNTDTPQYVIEDGKFRKLE